MTAPSPIFTYRMRGLLLAGAAIGLVPLQPAIAQTAATAPSATNQAAQPVNGTPPSADAGAGATADTAALTPSGQIGEVVVTAQKRSERLQNVPIAVTALGTQDVHPGSISTTADLTKAIPSLNFNEGTGAYAQPVLRGVGTTQSGPGIESPVASYIDGVYILAPVSQLFSLYDVAQVAVLKGPQGTLFGRNATGGVIQVTTLAPSYKFEARGDLTVGNLATFGQNLYVTGGLSDTLAASFTISHDDQKHGFGENLYTGDDVKTHQLTALRGKLRWQPGAATTVTLAGDYINRRATETANRPTEQVQGGPLPPVGKFDVNVNFDPGVHVRGGGGSLNVTHDFDAVQLVSITAYRKDHMDFHFDADLSVQAAGPNALSIYQTQYDHQFSEELQLISKGTGPLSYTAGLFYMSADSRYDPANTLPFGTLISLYADEGLKSYAAFAQLTYKLGDATNLTGGLRYTSDHRTLDSEQYRTLAGGTPTLIVTPIDTGKTFNKVTWRLSLDHRFSPDLLAYASYNRGFISGTYAPQIFPAQILNPEVLDAYEIGLKTDLLDRHVRFNPSAFYYTYHNRHVITIINGFQTAFVADKATIYGLDADLTVVPTDQLSISAGLGLLHTHYDNFDNGFISTPLPGGGNAVVFGSDTGNELEGASKFTMSVKPSYRLPTSIGEFRATANFYHNSGWFAGSDNRARQKAYNLVDADLLWTPTFAPNFSLRLWGKNIGNTRYALQYSETTWADNELTGAGRTYGATLGFKF